jgi:hypothetical protein
MMREGMRDWVIAVAALACMAGFGWLVVVLVQSAGVSSEIEWTRKMFILSGVEAIAFAGAGFLFGREVHRKEAEYAERTVVKAEENLERMAGAVAEAKQGAVEANQNREQIVTKALTLTSAIRGLNSRGGGDVELRGERLEGQRSGNDLLLGLTDELFPPGWEQRNVHQE